MTAGPGDSAASAAVPGAAGSATFAQVPKGLLLPDRPEEAHKGTFGTVIVVGGAVGFSGAPLMSATAAARGGAGKVHVCVPEPIYERRRSADARGDGAPAACGRGRPRAGGNDRAA